MIGLANLPVILLDWFPDHVQKLRHPEVLVSLHSLCGKQKVDSPMRLFWHTCLKTRTGECNPRVRDRWYLPVPFEGISLVQTLPFFASTKYPWIECHVFPAVEKCGQNNPKTNVVVAVVWIVPVAVGAANVPVVGDPGTAANHTFIYESVPHGWFSAIHPIIYLFRPSLQKHVHIVLMIINPNVLLAWYIS